MIHSLAGGKIKDLEFADFVKVKFDYLGETKLGWYITDIIDLAINDKVIIPYGYANIELAGQVEKIERNVSSQVAPIPIKRAKYIIKKL